jgi:ribosome-binding factor A
MIKSLICVIFILFSIILTATAQNERNSTSRWNHSDGSTELSVTMRNDVRFNDDYTDVTSINGNGSLEVIERRAGLSRQLKIVAGANGQLLKTYMVNGQERSFDVEGKDWLAKILAEAVGKGFDASARAKQIIRARGAAALVNEVPRLTGDYTKRVYLEEAVKSGNLDASALKEVLNQTETGISSDYEKATLLISTLSASPTNRKTLDAYFAAIGTIKSDYERGRVLKAVLKANAANKDILLQTLASAAKINSDYEKANVLIQVASAKAQDEAVRSALLNAVKTITSDYERGRVLNAVYLNEPK